MSNVRFSSKGWGRYTGQVHAAKDDGTAVCGATGKFSTQTENRVTCARCAKKTGAELPTPDLPLRTDSLLSAAKQRQMTVHQQMRSLQRIGARAIAHADWMRSLGDHEEAAKAEAKAKRAADELLSLARSINDPRARAFD